MHDPNLFNFILVSSFYFVFIFFFLFYSCFCASYAYALHIALSATSQMFYIDPISFKFVRRVFCLLRVFASQLVLLFDPLCNFQHLASYEFSRICCIIFCSCCCSSLFCFCFVTLPRILSRAATPTVALTARRISNLVINFCACHIEVMFILCFLYSTSSYSSPSSSSSRLGVNKQFNNNSI